MPVGLAALVTVAGVAVRAPGHATTTLVSLLALIAVSVIAIAVTRPSGIRESARIGLPVLFVALAVALIPFAAEGRFGILGTGFNPDMQQHLLIADWLSDRQGPEPFFIPGGYPIGPHGLAVGLADGLGTSLVHAFDGLTIAIAPLIALTALGALRDRPGWARVLVAVLAAFAYLAAAFLAQGAFKETVMALFLVAFAVGLAGLARTPEGAPANATLRALPLVVLGVGTVYVYSFPGLAWLAGAAAFWVLFELARESGVEADRRAIALRAAAPIGLGLLLFAVLTAPEWSRMVEFADFRAFDPPGRGLGNLFDSLSPLEALGVWPTGDYRLDPGEGSVPAALYYLGAVLGAIGLGWGLSRWWVAGERAVPAALAAAAVVYAGAAAFGTPYTAAKGLAVAAPLVVLVGAGGLLVGDRGPGQVLAGPRGLLALALAVALAGASLLALSRAQVGPTKYTADLNALRPLVEGKTVLALVPPPLAAERGEEFVSWELRGSERTIRVAGGVSGGPPPEGFRFVVAKGPRTPFTGLREVVARGEWRLWERRE